VTRLAVHESEVAWTKKDPPNVSKIPLHTHKDSQEAMSVIQGKGILKVNAKEIEMLPGTVIFSPPGVEYDIVNVGDGPSRASGPMPLRSLMAELGLGPSDHNEENSPESMCSIGKKITELY
jgi:hypothetical protein